MMTCLVPRCSMQLDAELGQLTGDATRTPRVGGGRALDDCADLGTDAGATALGSAMPGPILAQSDSAT